MSNPVEASDIISELKAISNENTVDIFLPSIASTVKFKRLNIKQQKSLVLVALDDALTQLNFSTNLYDILRENFPKEINVEVLNTFDKNNIIFNLIKDDSSDKSDPTSDQVKAIIKNYNKLKIPKKLLSTEIIADKIKITLSVPSLYTEYRFNKMLFNKYTAGVENRKQFIQDVYIIELAKYISKLVITKDKEIEVKLLEHSINDILGIIDALPVLPKILKYISDVKDIENTANTVDGKKIEVTPALFI